MRLIMLCKYLGHSRLGYAKHSGYGCHAKATSQFQSIVHLLLRKFGIWMCISTESGFSPFFYHVLRVVFGSPNKKMLGINAFRIVAGMANHHSFLNIAFMDHIRKPVRPYCLSFVTKSSISAAKIATFPNPTTIGFFNIRKKSFLIRHAIGGMRNSIVDFLIVMAAAKTKSFCFPAALNTKLYSVFDRVSVRVHSFIVSPVITFFAETRRLVKSFDGITFDTKHK